MLRKPNKIKLLSLKTIKEEDSPTKGSSPFVVEPDKMAEAQDEALSSISIDTDVDSIDEFTIISDDELTSPISTKQKFDKELTLDFDDMESPSSGISHFEEDEPFSAVSTESYDQEPSTALSEDQEEEEQTIPALIHFVWLGGPIKENYYNAIAGLTEQASRNGFQVNLWVDHKRNYEKTAYALGYTIPNLKIRNIHKLKFTLEESTLLDSEKIGAKNLAAAADIVRYKILDEKGGIYFDTDTTFDLGFHKNLIPETAKYGVLFHTEGMEWLQFNNDIIASTPGNPIIKAIFNKTIENYRQAYQTKQLQKKRLSQDKRKLTIYTSGPGVIIDVLKEYCTTKDKAEFKRDVSFERRGGKILVAGMSVKGEYDQTWLKQNKKSSYDDSEINYSDQEEKSKTKTPVVSLFAENKSKNPSKKVNDAFMKEKLHTTKK